MLSKREIANLMKRDTPMQPDEFTSILDSHEEFREVLEAIVNAPDGTERYEIAYKALKSC